MDRNISRATRAGGAYLPERPKGAAPEQGARRSFGEAPARGRQQVQPGYQSRPTRNYPASPNARSVGNSQGRQGNRGGQGRVSPQRPNQNGRQMRQQQQQQDRRGNPNGENKNEKKDTNGRGRRR